MSSYHPVNIIHERSFHRNVREAIPSGPFAGCFPVIFRLVFAVASHLERCLCLLGFNARLVDHCCCLFHTMPMGVNQSRGGKRRTRVQVRTWLNAFKYQERLELSFFRTTPTTTRNVVHAISKIRAWDKLKAGSATASDTHRDAKYKHQKNMCMHISTCSQRLQYLMYFHRRFEYLG